MDVSRYDERARGANAPLYAYYAEKIKETTGIRAGRCLDIGCGGGYLGLALAAITDLHVTFMDINKEMLERADAHIIEDGLEGRADTVHGDVHDIPLPDAGFDLVISRGSLPFWENPGKALSEIYRLLAPEGKTFVGGGKGTPEMRKRFEADMKKARETTEKTAGDAAGKNGKGRWGGRHGNPEEKMRRLDFDGILKDVGIHSFKIHTGDDGRWIQLWK